MSLVIEAAKGSKEQADANKIYAELYVTGNTILSTMGERRFFAMGSNRIYRPAMILGATFMYLEHRINPAKYVDNIYYQTDIPTGIEDESARFSLISAHAALHKNPKLYSYLGELNESLVLYPTHGVINKKNPETTIFQFDRFANLEEAEKWKEVFDQVKQN